MDPQQGTGHFPILKGTTFNKPCRGAFMVRGARSVLVYGRVWGQSHFLRSCRNWFPARALESLQATAGIRENERFRLLKSVARFCMAPIIFSPSNWLKGPW